MPVSRPNAAAKRRIKNRLSNFGITVFEINLLQIKKSAAVLGIVFDVEFAEPQTIHDRSITTDVGHVAPDPLAVSTDQPEWLACYRRDAAVEVGKHDARHLEAAFMGN
jgi:hypothetical protein